MAAPPEKTIHDLNGAWVMNYAESGDTAGAMQLQGIGWMLRKSIGLATVTLNLHQYKDEDGTEHIDNQQNISGLRGTRELRVLDWQWRDHTDFVFGHVRGRSRRMKISELPDDEDGEFMKTGWDEATLASDELIESYVYNIGAGWTANQTWGFEVVGDRRKYARHVIVKDKSGSKVMRLKLIYNYVGPASNDASSV